eukprot:TRINITY_DN4315_c0_g1_i1.p1 TRINITY_DN4315_c0_g1~~TRINITY_DN4315_c0_g1_i1.p1  ORF type:complete len:143 (-),score=23.08 TRINITY_DN4315_c0_g1_i1:13-381(-)
MWIRDSILGDWCGTNKRDSFHARVRAHGINGFLVTVHYVEHTIRQACLFPAFRQQERHAWVFLTWLQHISVAAGDSHTAHPQWNHRREVERCDTSDNTKWLCLLYTSPSPRDRTRSRMPSSA